MQHKEASHTTILVTGANGQLGKALQDQSIHYEDLNFIFTTKSELDITDPSAITSQLDFYKPDILINAAAYTAVDKAESKEEIAFLVNEKGTANVASACKLREISLVHISTDYVFDGKSNTRYTETDKVNPKTVYGKSKLAGEQQIETINPDRYAIIRTSWLYSNYNHNFYKTMLRLAKEGKKISVVDDQWGCPTLAHDLASAVIVVGLQLVTENRGIYHYSGKGSCTWYAFAKAILENSIYNTHTLLAVGSDAFNTVAKRPQYSVLSSQKIMKTFKISTYDWYDRLMAFMR